MFYRKRRLTALGALGFGGYLMAGTMAMPAPGQPVPDEVAAGLRGGICQWVAKSPCPGGGKGDECTMTGTMITSGSNYGSGSGNNPCGPMCGSFFSNYKLCVGS
jgi:hypothetical protein